MRGRIVVYFANVAKGQAPGALTGPKPDSMQFFTDTFVNAAPT
jgi:hypothetical protein